MLGFLLVVAAFGALVAFRLWRRDRPLRPGSSPLFSGLACVTAGIEFISYPFERVEVWPDALHLKNFGVAIPRSEVRSVATASVHGGLLVVLELSVELGWHSPLEITVRQPRALLAAMAPLLPPSVMASVRSADPPTA